MEIEKSKQGKEKQEGTEQNDTKRMLIGLAIVIGVIALIVGGMKLYGTYVVEQPAQSIDELHERNLAGKLPEEEGIVYNGYSFVEDSGLWWTEFTRFNTLVKAPLHYNPLQVEHITLTGTLDPAFEQKQDVFIAIDPNVADKYYTLALTELSFNIAKGVNRRPVAACTTNVTECADRDILSCEDTKGEPVIELVIANEAKVERMGTCIKVSGSGEELTKAANRLLYDWYGIIE